MPLTGYQDWQRVQYAAGFIVLNVNQAIQNQTTFNLPNVAAWPFLNVSFFAPAGASNYQVGVNFCSDSTFATIVATTSVTFNSNMNGLYCIPVLTPWAQVVITPNPTGNATAIKVSFYGALAYTEPWGFATFSTPMILGSHALGVNGTSNDFTFTNYEGNAILTSWASSTGTWQIDVAYFDFGAQAYKTYLHFSVAASAQLTVQVPIVFAQIRITLTNGSTSQTVNVALSAIP